MSEYREALIRAAPLAALREIVTHCSLPEFFLHSLGRFSPENKNKIEPMAWLAFGQGPRMYIGYRFAMMEMIVILTRVLQKFRVEACEETEVRFFTMALPSRN